MEVGQAVPDTPRFQPQDLLSTFNEWVLYALAIFGWEVAVRLTEPHFGDHFWRGCQAQPDLRSAAVHDFFD